METKTKTSDKEEDNLENFIWEGDSSSEDFFNIKDAEITDSVEFVKEAVKKDDEEIKPIVNLEEDSKDKKTNKSVEENTKKVEEEKTEKFFENNEENPNEDEIVTPVTSLSGVVKSLNTKGFFLSVDEEKGLPESLTDEDAEDLFEQEINHRLHLQMESLKTTAGEEGAELMKFLKDGGTVAEYLSLYNTQVDLQAFKKEDLEKLPDEAENFLIEYYQEYEEMDKEEAKDKIEFLKERDKLNSTATKIYDRLDKESKEEKDKVLKEQKIAKDKREKDATIYKADLKKVIDETEVVGTVKINKKEKVELYDYLIKPTIKTGKGFITGLQKDLSDIYADKKLLIALAKVIKEKFNIKDFSTETQVTQKIKQTLRSGSKQTPKNLTDYF